MALSMEKHSVGVKRVSKSASNRSLYSGTNLFFKNLFREVFVCTVLRNILFF